MCFSAESSFAASAVLLSSGAYCLRAAARKKIAWVPLALVPVIFGVQQLAEGLVWVGLGRHDAGLVRVASLTFLFFATCFWPVWVPFSMVFIEDRRKVRAVLGLVASLGLAFGCLLGVPFALGEDHLLEVGVRYHSIQYSFHDIPAFAVVPQEWWQVAYLLIVSSPLLVSGDRRHTLLCALLIVSAAISQLVFWYAFISVWCFFAALLSLQLCYVINRRSEPGDTPVRAVRSISGVPLIPR